MESWTEEQQSSLLFEGSAESVRSREQAKKSHCKIMVMMNETDLGLLTGDYVSMRQESRK